MPFFFRFLELQADQVVTAAQPGSRHTRCGFFSRRRPGRDRGRTSRGASRLPVGMRGRTSRRSQDTVGPFVILVALWSKLQGLWNEDI